MNEEIFNDIYDKYVNVVWRTAKYYSGNQMDADEITQLTFVNLLVGYEKIRNKDAIESWLRTTAYRLACSQMRKRKLEMPMDDAELAAQMGEEVPSPDELIFMRERRRKETDLTSTMLEELYQHNEKWYDAVVRAYVLEIPQKEIAEEMGIRLEAFQSLLFRARKWMKTKYEADYREMK
nr:RNA polymerase sigma factor [uncultured Sellimonas sp.]